MVTLLEVMITSQVTITSQEVIVTSPINEQMVEAKVKMCRKGAGIDNCTMVAQIMQESF